MPVILEQLHTLPLSTLAPLVLVLLIVVGAVWIAAYMLIVNAVERSKERRADREAQDHEGRVSR